MPQQQMMQPPPMQGPPQQMYQEPPMQMYQQPPNQMPPMVQQAPQLAQAPVQISGPTESSPDDKEQQRAQAAASIEAYEQYMKSAALRPRLRPPSKPSLCGASSFNRTTCGNESPLSDSL